jgi:hypothetical protein
MVLPRQSGRDQLAKECNMPDAPADRGPGSGLPAAVEPTQRWFAGKDVDTLLYKINRRTPAAGETIFPQPESVLAHLEEVLAVSVPVETGRAYKRLWHIGNKVFDYRAGTLTGRVGWTRPQEVLAPVWDDDRQEWADRVVPGDVTVVASFAFTVDGRYLGVLRHSSFREKTIADVFIQILNRGEARRREPGTDWDVEPIGDDDAVHAPALVVQRCAGQRRQVRHRDDRLDLGRKDFTEPSPTRHSSRWRPISLAPEPFRNLGGFHCSDSAFWPPFAAGRQLRRFSRTVTGLSGRVVRTTAPSVCD